MYLHERVYELTFIYECSSVILYHILITYWSEYINNTFFMYKPTYEIRNLTNF